MRELGIFLEQDRASTYSYFQQKYGASDGPAFWTTRFGSQTPSQHLMALALTDVTKTSVQFDAAYKRKLVEAPGYPEFLNAWQEENARRRQAIAENKPIYGPQQYTEADYLSYVVADLAAELQSDLVADGTISASDVALRKYYDEHISDFANGQTEGPFADQFVALKKQITAAYLSAEYDSYISRLASEAKVSLTPQGRAIVSSGCLVSSRC